MANESVHTFTSGNFSAEVEQAGAPVLVDFWAPWCGPCRMIAPVIDELAGEYNGTVKVGKVNVDDNQDVAAKYGVMSIPTILVFRGGQPVERIVGFQDKRSLKAKVDAVLAAK